jgi:hypothetical protein
MKLFYNKSKNEFKVFLFYIAIFCLLVALGFVYLAPLTVGGNVWFTKTQVYMFTGICCVVMIFSYFQAND